MGFVQLRNAGVAEERFGLLSRQRLVVEFGLGSRLKGELKF